MMKKYYSDLSKDLKLYKNIELMVGDNTNKTENSVVVILSQSRDDFINMYNKELFSRPYIKAYYVPRRFKLTSLRNENVRYDQVNQYDRIDKHCSMINFTRPRLDNYGTRNMYYDTFPLQRAFMDRFGTMSPRKKVRKYNDFLQEILSGVVGKDMYFAINVDERIGSAKPSLINILYDMCYYNMVEGTVFEIIPVIVYSKKTGNFFKTYLGNRSEGFKVQRFEKLCNLLYNMDGPNRFSESEKEEIAAMDEEEEDNQLEDLTDDLKSGLGDELKDKIQTGLNLNKNLNKLDPEDLEIIDMLDSKIDSLIQDLGEEDLQADEVENILNMDTEFLGYLDELKQSQISIEEKEEKEIKKKKLSKKQEQALDTMDGFFDNMGKSIDSIIDDYKVNAIEIEEIDIDGINELAKKSTLKDMDRNYNKLQANKDLMKIITSFNEDPEFPLYATDVKIEDSSNEFNKKSTVKIKYEDTSGKRHNVSVDIPQMVDDRFLYLNNGKKSISKQMASLPIIKTGDDEVQLTSNYKAKMFVYRFGQKTDPNVDRFNKFVKKEIDKYKEVKYFLGSSKGVNKNYKNTLEYVDISNNLITLEFKGYKFNFNRKEILDNIYEDNVTNDINLISVKGEYPFGYNKQKEEIFFVSLTDSRVYVRNPLKQELRSYGSIVECLIVELSLHVDEDIVKNISKQTISKRFIYSRVNVLSRKIPLILVLGFKYGFEYVINSYGVEWKFEKKNIRLSDSEKLQWNRIIFKDGYFYYKIKPLRHALLVNGISEIDTKELNFSDMNKTSTYMDIFEELYGSRNIIKGLNNLMNLFLDPITKDVLKNMDMPTNLMDLLLYANTLLEDSDSQKLNDLSNYRIRGNEIIYATLYNVLADSYKTYKDMKKSGSRDAKISVKQDQLLKELLQSPLVDEFSILNPVLEAEKLGTATFKGLGGREQDQSFTIDMRAYDKSMTGTIGFNSPDSNKVGVVRQLNYDPSIINNRGMLKTDLSYDELNAYNMMTPSELLNPFTTSKADPPRTGMATTQTKHLMPTKESSKPLFGSGVEKTLAYIIGNDFAHKAKEDGEVKLLDIDNELMILKYDDDTEEVIDLAPVQAKNSNGGFYITNQKEPMLKEGDKFKKNEIIAKNDDYFKGDIDDVTFTPGRLTKVAIHSGDYTLEDSSIITTKLTDGLSSNVTMKKDIGGLGVNTNIISIKKRGELIRTGEPLLVFEQSFDDGDANKLLDSLDDEFSEILENLGRNRIISKYTGKIVDVKIYWNKDIEEFSPSVQKVIKDYIKSIDKRKKIAGHSSSTIFPPTRKISGNKVGGNDIDGLYIEYYIKYNDVMGIGDKVTFDSVTRSQETISI